MSMPRLTCDPSDPHVFSHDMVASDVSPLNCLQGVGMSIPTVLLPRSVVFHESLKLVPTYDFYFEN